MTLARFHNMVAGRLQPASATFESLDPYTGRPWALIPLGGAAEVDAAMEAGTVWIDTVGKTANPFVIR